MTLSQAALLRRRSYLTASDVPAVLGLSRFRTPLMVWTDKTGQGEPVAENAAMMLGDDLETPLIMRAARSLNLVGVKRNQWRVSAINGVGNGLLAATLDAIGVRVDAKGDPLSEVGIEAKSSGILNPGADLDAWGEAGTAEVPDHVAVQVQVQLLCAEIDVGYVSALLGQGKGGRIYVLPRDAEAIKIIAARCLEWWDTYVVKGVQPPVTSPADNEPLRWIRRQPGKVTIVAPEIARAWLDAKERKRQAESDLGMAEAALKGALGDAEVGDCGIGQVRYTEESAGIRVNADVLREQYPEVAAKVSEATHRKVLRWRGVK